MRTFPSREPVKAVRDESSSPDLDSFIESFETAWAQRGDVNLADFLPPRHSPLYLQVLCELIRVDLELRWQNGSPRSLDCYERAFPEAFEKSETRGQIAFEERRLRLQAEISSSRESGPTSPTSAPDPHSEPASNVVAAACKQVKHAAPGDSPLSGDHSFEDGDLLPAVGSDFLGFQLIGELGVGAFSRVYLARQGELADRFVVLKVSADIYGESQKLAQLQHTNIVPIYSVHRLPPLQAVCMPFYGSTTLKDVIHDLSGHDTQPTSGQDLLNAVGSRNHKLLASACSPPKADAQADWQYAAVDRTPASGHLALTGLNYVQAVLWIGARLAEGLAHAHQRGILHCDLKPANVLLTDDGQPLLLDFNMSRDLKLNRPSSGVGGTPLYMAPEHLRAFRGAEGHVDTRSDIYSLGVILYQLLTGQFPFAVRLGRLPSMLPVLLEDRLGPVPTLRPWNQAITPAVEAMVRHCLEPKPENRYQSAAELIEDLNLHENDRPLRHAPEPSFRERLAKWIRRHPRLSSGASVASISLAAIGFLTALSMVGWHYRSQMLARQSFQSFHGHMERAQLEMYSPRPDSSQLERAVNECQQAMLPYLLPVDAHWTQASLVQSLPPEMQQQLREEMGELLYLAAEARWRLSGRDSAEASKKLRLALECNGLAIECYGSGQIPSVIWQQRAMLLEQAVDPQGARESRARAQAAPLATARDYFLQAQADFHTGAIRKAVPLVDQATQMNPRDFFAWFIKGECHDNIEQYASAEAAYSVCISIRPELAWTWYHRGWARLKQQRFQAALIDFDQVLHLEPGCADAYINRALARQGLGNYRKAIEDLTRALELETNRTQVYFMRALAREQMGDRAGARADRREGMRLEPRSEAGWIARGLARQETDAAGALRDFDAALAINPSSASALQNKAHVLGECLGKDRDAIAVLNTAISLFPDNYQFCAGRGVHLARLGEDEQALSDAQHSLALSTEPSNMYQVACIFALTTKRRPENRPRACELLARALAGGFGREFVDKDSDLDPIRDSTEYRHVIEAARPLKNRKK
jgi:serine/threonine protein kinase/tetratricopeptide (TPR) repeat protein